MRPPRQYVKKPVRVAAVQFSDISEADEIAKWCNGWVQGSRILIRTLEGPMTASLGDYIVRGVMGEYYPVKPAIFHQTYSPA